MLSRECGWVHCMESPTRTHRQELKEDIQNVPLKPCPSKHTVYNILRIKSDFL